MPPPTLNYEPYKEEITQLTRTNISTVEIVRILQNRHGIAVTERTLKRRLQRWGIERRIKTKDSGDLRAQISILFRMNCTDDEMVEDLVSGGVNIGKTAVSRIRKSLGLFNRLTVGDRARMDEELFVILAREVDDGRVEGYGKRLLHSYFKSKGYLVTR